MKTYLFVDENDSRYITTKETFKDAILDLADYHGELTYLFSRSLMGFEEEDKKGIIDLYNHWAYHSLENVYVIEEIIYPQIVKADE